jgi:dTDP-4-amino-4,6-dideoxygalactose transaminase
MCGREMEYIKSAFDTNWIAPLGFNVTAFEAEVAGYIGVKHALALSSGTAAIHLALKWFGVGEDGNDIVFCSSLTFAGSCNAITYLGAKPVFIDSDAGTWNMSPKALKKAYELYPKPKAVIVVNLYGQAADYDEILKITREHNTPVIEDAAESIGASYKGRQTGSFGDISVFSFNGNKIVTTSGGGMAVSNDEAAIKKMFYWATQARDPAPHYQHTEIGFNYRMSNVCAGIGRGQLTVLNERIERKKYIYEFYKEAFSDIDGISMMPIAGYGEPNYWLSCAVLNDTAFKPADIISALEKENIEARPVWKPMHMQPVYSDCAFVSGDESGSVSEDIFNKGLCLPSDTKSTDDELETITELVRGCFRC